MRGERKRIALRPDAIPEGMPLAVGIAHLTADWASADGGRRRSPSPGGRCAWWEGAEGGQGAIRRVVGGLVGQSRANGRVCACRRDSLARIGVLPFAQTHVREHVRHRLARMGDFQASSRIVIGAARSPDRQGLCLRLRTILPNVCFRPGETSHSHDPVRTACAPRSYHSHSHDSAPSAPSRCKRRHEKTPAHAAMLSRDGGPSDDALSQAVARAAACVMPSRRARGREMRERSYSSPPLGALSASP